MGRPSAKVIVVWPQTTHPMQRPIIFLATNDHDFEGSALNAILETCHGVRRAYNLRGAGEILAKGTDDIALAVIDLDLENKGLSLLHILGGCEPDFPIIVIGQEKLVRENETVSAIASACFVKPVTVEELRHKIQEVCSQTEMTHDESFQQGLHDRRCRQKSFA